MKFNIPSLNWLKKIRPRYFSFRGLALILLGIFTLKYVAEPESDLILWMLGGAAIFFPFISLCFGVFLHQNLKKHLQIKNNLDGTHGISNRPLKSGLTLRECDLFPFFELKVERRFIKPGVISPTHIVRGSERRGELRFLIDELIFPHRGIWRLKEIQVSVGDFFGLTYFPIVLPAEEEIEVFAPIEPIRPLPIVASSARAGDLLDSKRDRTGDPFDLKAYDPSDGISRILWKTYAKSGELVVRRPEPSVIPEGEVAIFVVAKREDDHIVGAFSSYFKELERNNVTALFGTDAGAHRIITEESEIYRTLHEAVWNEKSGSAADFGEFLDLLLSSGRMLTQVVVFGSDRPEKWHQIVLEEAARRDVLVAQAIVPGHFKLTRTDNNGMFLGGPKSSIEQLAAAVTWLSGQRGREMKESQHFYPPPGGQLFICERNEQLQ